jgi:riboflavin biosynthesis pyrimidine reductase
MYETLSVWDTPELLPDQTPIMLNFSAAWRNADKIVYSSSLESVSTARTRLERTFEPNAVRHLKDQAERDLSIAGPTLAAHAFRAGLIDEVHLFLAPCVVGGGTRALPENVRLDLELLDERRFADGMIYLHYRSREH